MRGSKLILYALSLFASLLFVACTPSPIEGSWDYELSWNEDDLHYGVLKITNENGAYSALFNSFQMGKLRLQNLEVSGNSMRGNFEKWDDTFVLEGNFRGDSFKGTLQREDDTYAVIAKRQTNEILTIDRSDIAYVLSDNDLEETELNIDHAGLLADSYQKAFERGERIYNSNCINCHGNPDIEGSIPLSLKFWEEEFKAGDDPYSMYKAISRGYATMPPQLKLTPREKYDVITYVREAFVRDQNPDAYFTISEGYLAGLPKGTSKGLEPKPYHPWSDQDYGNFFINTYELVDAETGAERYHSPGPTPFADEDYTKNNFAYKGIAVRLDKGKGGIAQGKAWMLFDHDLMRVAGGWTGEGFIDWDAILLNDRHETYPRTIGKLHFETPVGPGWANPKTGTFDDPRFTARDGRKFGPLPKAWADYKGLYHHGEHMIISYSVGTAAILEQLGMEQIGEQTVFTRTLNISPSTSLLRLRLAKDHINVQISGNGATLSKEGGYVLMTVKKSQAAKVKLFIADTSDDLAAFAQNSKAPESLKKYTKGGPAHYPQEINSSITKGSEDAIFAVDQLSPPYENPWNCRMKLSGIDFMKDGNKAVACTTDGDVWLISGLTDGGTTLKWKRIGAGLFQPLGIKVVNEQIFVTCRDQLVRLHDFNGDDETDFYESFNHDHQVSDHFHEFAMGLQADEEGNLYYAKSGRHAREALIPQHGTLIKVSSDGAESEIIAKGFRAANGVCINPDGSFLVTDQQGYWNPMNRINWITVAKEPKFYGNMWGYDPPKDSTRTAMEPPMAWVDMEFDRSPSELVWVDSEKWGAMNGGLLSFSYGYGKVQWVLNEEVQGQRQGGVIDIPGMKFYTGVMRGRFHPEDKHLYLCGMEAWSTSQNMRPGDLYRIRYTGKTVPMPIALNAVENGVQLTFASKLEAESATNSANYEVKTWDLIRSRKYGSDRHNVKSLKISEVRLTQDGKGVLLVLKDIAPVDIMTIRYNISDVSGTRLNGTIQNTIHVLGKASEDGKSIAIN